MRIDAQGRLAVKRGWYHYLTREPGGRVKWLALRTRSKAEALKRVARLAGVVLETDDRTQWLKGLAEVGDWARRELAAAQTAAVAEALKWEGLLEHWRRVNPKLSTHEPTQKIFGWVTRNLEGWALARGIGHPAELQAGMAREFAALPRKETQVNLLRRIWRDVGLPDVWPEKVPHVAGFRYRRMTVAEVRALVRVLREGRPAEAGSARKRGEVRPQPEVADMAVLAYHTGLRRSDVAGLARHEVDESGEFLRVVARKTARRKGTELLIPLQEEPREIVARRMREAEAAGADGLFSPIADAHLAFVVAAALERAGIVDTAAGKASFHSLRATFISMMDEAGVPPHVTDAITGHASGGMHGRYSQPSRSALMDAVSKAVLPICRN